MATLNGTQSELLSMDPVPRKIKMVFDRLPIGARLTIHYDNGCYAGVENRIINYGESSGSEVADNGTTGIRKAIYSYQVTKSNSGETTFEESSETREGTYIYDEREYDV